MPLQPQILPFWSPPEAFCWPLVLGAVWHIAPGALRARAMHIALGRSPPVVLCLHKAF